MGISPSPLRVSIGLLNPSSLPLVSSTLHCPIYSIFSFVLWKSWILKISAFVSILLFRILCQAWLGSIIIIFVMVVQGFDFVVGFANFQNLILPVFYWLGELLNVIWELVVFIAGQWVVKLRLSCYLLCLNLIENSLWFWCIIFGDVF